jgi:thiol-disulfide isomerase/thioredoxin
VLRTLSTFVLLFFSFSLLAAKEKKTCLKTGDWYGQLELSINTSLPFKLTVNKSSKAKSGYSYTIWNGNEQITLTNDRIDKDSLILDFPSFDSHLVLKTSKKRLVGFWYNKNKKNYSIPCVIKHGYHHRFERSSIYLSSLMTSDFNGKWECDFEPGTNDIYKALALFNQKGNMLTGTFLTETGDYRFLEGNVIGDSLFLSCFDGSHAFLFTGVIKSGKINGLFYSGKHWNTEWTAVKNEQFELSSPDSLTYLTTKEKFTFSLPQLNGENFVFPNENFENKVTIIQIMGTWCPNCMDETRYFKDLFDKYHSKGLEIIAVGYEVGDNFKEQSMKIQTLQERYNLDFTFLVGGSANKGLAADHFSMLNNIISFPTAIFIDKNGEVRKIHTGFNGPGTGQYYQEYIISTEALIQELLKETN